MDMEESDAASSASSPRSSSSSSSNGSNGGPGPRTTYGIGRPLLGYRNHAAYAHAQEGPDTRLGHAAKAAQAQAKLLQRWQPDLMLDTDCTVELLKEHHEQRPAQRQEGLGLQGNTVWLPFVVPTPQKRLLVHAGGPYLERLHLSWLTEEARKEKEEKTEGARDRAHYPTCKLAVGRWASGEVGTIRQVAPLNQFEAGEPAWETEPPTCFVRGTCEAALLQLRPRNDNREMPYYVAPLQKLQFQDRLVDVATRPASVHRAAFLTEAHQVFEWTSAAGATRVDVELPPRDEGPTFAVSPTSRLAWGAHPRHLWLSAHSSLYCLDLRQKTIGTTISPLSTGRLPEGLVDANEPAGGAGIGPLPPPIVGAVERHPFDENLLFVSADEYLVALDLRQAQSPIAVLRQAEPCHLMSVGVHQDKTWVAAGCRTLPRLHLHMEAAGSERRGSGPSGLNIVEEWCTGVEWMTRGGGQPRPLQYQTSTFVNWDSTPERGQPVWLAGLGLAPSFSSPSTFFLPYVTSLGDVYIQRLCQAAAEEVAGVPLWEAKDLPCGLSPHLRTAGTAGKMKEEEEEQDATLPSSAFFQRVGKGDHSLRDYSVAALDPPEVLFGDILPSFSDGMKEEGEREEGPRRGALACVLEEHRASLIDYLDVCPRSLVDVVGHLETLAPGRVVRGKGGQVMRDLYYVLREELEEFESICHARVSLPPPHVLRAEEGQQEQGGKRRRRKQGQEDEEMEEGGECTCDLSDTQATMPPCLSASCLVPSLSLYWCASGEALLPKTTEDEEEEEDDDDDEEEEEGGGGSKRKKTRPSPLQGLDGDSIHWLRGKWHEAMM